MKQTILMLVLLSIGTIGALVKGPFYAIAVYYLFAVLRPQYLWQWALTLNIGWSFYVAIAAILSSFLWRQNAHHVEKDNSGAAFMLAFAVWITLSYFFAVDRSVSYPYYFEYFKIFIMFFCSVRVIKEFPQVKTLYVVAVVALAYIAYEMNALYIFDGRLDIYRRGYGGLDNNGAGLMIAMGIPLAYFLWQGWSGWLRWFILALIPPMLHAVLMSYSRGAMLSLLLVSPLLIMRSANKKLVILAMAGASLLIPALAGQEIQERFFTLKQYEEDGSAQSRFDSWSAAYHIALDYPVFGAGVRNANLLSYYYGADMMGRTIHSQYLQIAADSGFPAMALYLSMLFVAWRTLRNFQKQHRHSKSEDELFAYNLACGLEASLVVFCIGAAFLSLENFELPYLLILLAFQLPIAFSREQIASTTSNIMEPAEARNSEYARCR